MLLNVRNVVVPCAQSVEITRSGAGHPAQHVGRLTQRILGTYDNGC